MIFYTLHTLDKPSHTQLEQQNFQTSKNIFKRNEKYSLYTYNGLLHSYSNQ